MDTHTYTHIDTGLIRGIFNIVWWWWDTVFHIMGSIYLMLKILNIYCAGQAYQEFILVLHLYCYNY